MGGCAALGLLAAMCLLFCAVAAQATPIQPDVRKLLSQPEKANTSVEFIPARAGWEGPEMTKGDVAQNPTLEVLGPAASARAARRSLSTAAIPDPRALAAVVLVILLLRRLRKLSGAKAASVTPVPSAPPASPQEQPLEVRPAA
jgi:hypothetical protein